MLTIIIGFIAFVAIISAANNGEWGSVLLGVGIVVVLILMADGDRKDTKAWMNCRDYWAAGGPEQYRRKQSHR